MTISRVLVVAAHPDDEIIGCGGTVARHVEEGAEVTSLILGEGVTSRDRQRDIQSRNQELEALRFATKMANTTLGVSRVITRDLPDNRFDSVPLLEIVKLVEEVKVEVNPDVVYTHHGGDVNVDHQRTFRSVLTAFRPLPGERTAAIYAFETTSSTEWAAPFVSERFIPNVYVDISATLETKLKALSSYASELREYPHPRSLKGFELIARCAGMECGVDAAERFALIREVRRSKP